MQTSMPLLSPLATLPARDGGGGVCRLVMNKESQQFKGTAFVEYWDISAAQAAAAACKKARYCFPETFAFASTLSN